MASTLDQQSDAKISTSHPDAPTDASEMHEAFRIAIAQPSASPTLKDLSSDLRACFFLQHANYEPPKQPTLSLNLFLTLLKKTNVVPSTVSLPQLHDLLRYAAENTTSAFTTVDRQSEQDDLCLDFDAFLQTFACIAFLLFVHDKNADKETEKSQLCSMSEALKDLKGSIMNRIYTPSSTPTRAHSKEQASKFYTPASKFRTPYHKRIENSAMAQTAQSMAYHTPKEKLSPVQIHFDDTATPANSNTLSSIDPNTLPREIPSPSDQQPMVSPTGMSYMTRVNESPAPFGRAARISSPLLMASNSMNATPTRPSEADANDSQQTVTFVGEGPVGDGVPLDLQEGAGVERLDDGLLMEVPLAYASPILDDSVENSPATNIEPSTEPSTPFVARANVEGDVPAELLSTGAVELRFETPLISESNSECDGNATACDVIEDIPPSSSESNDVSDAILVDSDVVVDSAPSGSPGLEDSADKDETLVHDPASPEVDVTPNDIETSIDEAEVELVPKELSDGASTTNTASQQKNSLLSSDLLSTFVPSVDDVVIPLSTEMTLKKDGDLIDTLVSQLEHSGSLKAGVDKAPHLTSINGTCEEITKEGEEHFQEHFQECVDGATGEQVATPEDSSVSSTAGEEGKLALPEQNSNEAPAEALPESKEDSLHELDLSASDEEESEDEKEEVTEKAAVHSTVSSSQESEAEAVVNPSEESIAQVDQDSSKLENIEKEVCDSSEDGAHQLSVLDCDEIAGCASDVATAGTDVDRSELLASPVAGSLLLNDTPLGSPSRSITSHSCSGGSPLPSTSAVENKTVTVDVCTSGNASSAASSTVWTGFATRADDSWVDTLQSPPGNFLSPELSEVPSVERVRRWSGSRQRSLSFRACPRSVRDDVSDLSSTYSQGEVVTSINLESQSFRDLGEEVDDTGLSAEEESEDDDMDGLLVGPNDDVDIEVDATEQEDCIYDTSFFENTEDILASAMLVDDGNAHRDSMGDVLGFHGIRNSGHLRPLDENVLPGRESFEGMFQEAMDVKDFVREVADCTGDNDTFMGENCLILSDLKPPRGFIRSGLGPLDRESDDGLGRDVDSERRIGATVVGELWQECVDAAANCGYDDCDITMVDINTSESGDGSRPVSAVDSSKTVLGKSFVDADEDEEDVEMLEDDSESSADLSPETFAARIRKYPRSPVASMIPTSHFDFPGSRLDGVSDAGNDVLDEAVNEGDVTFMSQGTRLETLMDMVKDVASVVRQNAKVCKDLQADATRQWRATRGGRRSRIVRFVNSSVIFMFVCFGVMLGAMVVTGWNDVFTSDGKRFSYVYV